VTCAGVPHRAEIHIFARTPMTDLLSSSAMPSWADMVESEDMAPAAATKKGCTLSPGVAAELDLAANCSRDGLNLSFKSVGAGGSALGLRFGL
jgi:hypothetical protein